MKKINTDKKNVFAKLDKNIPAQKKALDNLEEYQRRTGLTQKDALMFILLQLKQPIWEVEGKHDNQDVSDEQESKESEGRKRMDEKQLESAHTGGIGEKKDTSQNDIHNFLNEEFDYT